MPYPESSAYNKNSLHLANAMLFCRLTMIYSVFDPIPIRILQVTKIPDSHELLMYSNSSSGRQPL